LHDRREKERYMYLCSERTAEEILEKHIHYISNPENRKGASKKQKEEEERSDLPSVKNVA